MMLRFIAFLLLFTVSVAPAPAFAADPVFPLGSRMGFVPPPGFVASKRFPGFENADTRSTAGRSRSICASPKTSGKL